MICAGPVSADIVGAAYGNRTDVYGHGVVPGGEYEGITFRLADGRVMATSALGVGAVYEDTEPRLVDLDGDGTAEVITVVSYFDRGAAIRIWDEVVSAEHPHGSTIALVAETPAIGRRHRWLAMIGAADLDGDGFVEIAYIDRPHLAKTLRVWRFQGGALHPVADLPGLTNHRIGEADIGGGIRDCGQGPEMITANADWSRVMATTLDDGELTTRDIGRHVNRSSFAVALACEAPS
jgi:hypothetical protein